MGGYLTARTQQAGGHGGHLFILTLLLGMASVGGRFVVEVELSSTTPKPESRLDVTCNFNLTHTETEQLVFYDLNSQTICLFLVRENSQQCTSKYNSSVINKQYISSIPGRASLTLQLQPCEALTGVRCAVTDTGATERSGTANFQVQNIPAPHISCVGDCEDSTTAGKRTLRLDTNSTQSLTCSVTDAVPEVTFTVSSPYTVNTTVSTPDTDSCTFNQTVTVIPTAAVTTDTAVTCTVTGPGGVTASSTVTVAVGRPNNGVPAPTHDSQTIGLALGIPVAVAVLVGLAVGIWYFKFRKTPDVKKDTTDAQRVKPGNDMEHQ